MEKTAHFSGALHAGLALAHELLAEIENGDMVERQGFEDLIRGSPLIMDEVMRRVQTANRYVPAGEALRLGRVAGPI